MSAPGKWTTLLAMPFCLALLAAGLLALRAALRHWPGDAGTIPSLAMTLVGAVVSFLGAVATFGAWRCLDRTLKLERKGLLTEGLIYARRLETGSIPGPHMLAYRFAVRQPGKDSRLFTAWQPVKSKVYGQLPAGSPVTICYLSNDPTVSWLVLEKETSQEAVI